MPAARRTGGGTRFFRDLLPLDEKQASTHQLSHCTKRQKLDSKNSWNWCSIFVPATIWQVLNLKRMHWPETKAVSICWNFNSDVTLTVDGAKFWISCPWLAFLSILSCWQLIQNQRHLPLCRVNGGFHLHLLVFCLVYQFNSKLEALVCSSFTND